MSPYSDEEYFYKMENMVIGSTQYLRKIFKTRWKIETGEDWRDGPDFIQNFLTQHCKNIFKKAISFQKKILLASASLEDWDISLMSFVLLNFGDETKYSTQNQAVRQLKDLRNDLAHHKSKRLTQNGYCEKLKLFKESLQTLEINKSEIEKLVKESSVKSSFEDTEQLKMCLKTAEQFMKSKDFESALKQYSAAIAIPRLSPVTLGEVYEKRADCYLSLTDKNISDRKHTEQAILDCNKALKLNKKSWNAHYLKAQCYKLKNNLSDAVRYYEMALAISPLQKRIKKDLDSCKLLMLAQQTNAQLNDDQLPKSASEIIGSLGNVVDESGNKLTLTKFFKFANWQNHPVYVGEQHYYGLEVPQNYAKALKYFMQADKEGFAMGTYKVGLCYYRGHGVQQDARKAVEIYRRCAAMDAKKRGEFEHHTPLGFNYAVAYAENGIGKCYEEGIGVEKNFFEAANWYQRGMEHGHPTAATNLGLLYLYGRGLTKNEKMADMCFKQGLNLGNTSAAEILIDYYQDELEPEMAWIMFQIAREMGHEKFLNMSLVDFSRQLTMGQSDRCRLEGLVITFEKRYAIEFKGITFKQRLTRYQQHLDPNWAKINKIGTTCDSGGGDIQRISKSVMAEVGIKGARGSKTAKDVLKTIESIFDLNDILEMENVLSRAFQLKAVNLFYDCMIREDHLKCLVKNVSKFQAVVEELFNETCQQTNEEEMKIRLCYVGYNLWSALKSRDDLYAFGILKEGLRRYTNNYGYTRLLINCLKSRKSYEDALQQIDKALEKFPEKADLYYLKADVLRKSEKMESSNIIAAFKLFLDKAPRDHRFVPEAYYEISLLLMEDYIKYDQANNLNYVDNHKVKLILQNYQLGKNAEKEQLPCYQPYGVSESQSIVEGFFGKLNNHGILRGYSTINMTVLPTFVEIKSSVLERKEYMKSPVRKSLILQHRERIRDRISSFECDDEVVPAKLLPKRANKMADLKPITLQEMNPTKNKIYENRILDLTIIEDPNVYFNSIQLIGEDDNGDTTRVHVDPLALEAVYLERFAFGSRIAVINPCMANCAVIEVNGIRINESNCIMYLEKAKNVCRFCGEEHATRKCSNCKRLYCSRECQKLDWELFEHKLICSVVHENKNSNLRKLEE